MLLNLPASVWKNVCVLKRWWISWKGYFCQILWFKFHRLHLKPSLQYDLQVHAKLKFWKSKKISSIQNNNLIELMMYMARRRFFKKELVQPPQTTPRYPIPLYLLPNLLLYVLFTLNHFVYLLSQWNVVHVLRCLIAQYNEQPYNLVWVFVTDKHIKWIGRVRAFAPKKT